jgi:hypothetical protein
MKSATVGTDSGEPNEITLYMAAHGSDGIVGGENPSMLNTLNEKYGELLPEGYLGNLDSNLYVGEMAGISGICLLTLRSPDTESTSYTETRIENISQRAHQSILKGHANYLRLLELAKKIYISDLTLMKNPSAENAIAKTQSDLMIKSRKAGISYKPTLSQRDKKFQFLEEYRDGDELGEHYGIHVLNVRHDVVSLNERDNLVSLNERHHGNSLNIQHPFPNDRQADVREVINPRPSRPTFSYLGLTMPTDDDTPYNICIKQDWILALVKSKYPEECNEKTICLVILEKFKSSLTNGRQFVQLSEIWLLFHLLGFKNIYIIDYSCRELQTLVQGSTLKSGTKHGNRDTLVETTVHHTEDPFGWTEDPSQFHPPETRLASEALEKLLHKIGGGTRKTKRRKTKRRKTKRRKTKRRKRGKRTKKYKKIQNK